jgi:hypothetical protein
VCENILNILNLSSPYSNRQPVNVQCVSCLLKNIIMEKGEEISINNLCDECRGDALNFCAIAIFYTHIGQAWMCAPFQDHSKVYQAC